MTIETQYKEKILEEILREYLAQGIIPTADQLLEDYEARARSDMSIPLLAWEVYEGQHIVTENSDSSASAYNTFFSGVKRDLEVLYEETWELTKDGMQSFDRWRIELEALRRELVDLEARIDSLLITRQDTAGYFSFVEDRFVDLNKVDQPNTTANVDIVNHTVTMAEDSSLTSKVLPDSIPTNGGTFTVLTREDMVSARVASGSGVRRAIEDLNKSWQHRVFTTIGSKAISGELKIRLSDDDPVSISRVIMELHSADNNSAVLLVGQYSLDNYNWYNFPTDNYTQSTDDRAVFLFTEPVDAKYVKFIMTKIGPDDIVNGYYVYEFGAKTVDFYSVGFSVTSGSVLLSQELSAYDDDENRIQFNKVALEVCQDVPEDTAIQYWIKAGNGSEATPYLRIDPFNVDSPTAVTSLDLGRLSTTEAESLYKVKKHTAGDPSTESRDYFTQYIGEAGAGRLALIGTSDTEPYKLDQSTIQSIIEDSIVLYRNVGPRYGNRSYGGGDSASVRDAPRGWAYDETNSYLMTTIVINNPDGMTVDLGPNPAIVDGQSISGEITLTGYNPDKGQTGIHTFKTHIDNTGDILAEYSSLSTLQAADEKYPYNHQKLIEGYAYPSSFDGEQVYTGVDLYCQHVITKNNRVSIFDLLNNTRVDDFSRYATDLFRHNTHTSGEIKRVFVVRFDPDITDYENERFAISFSTGSNMFDRIVLKAELSSDDANKSPVLTSYRVKLGA